VPAAIPVAIPVAATIVPTEGAVLLHIPPDTALVNNEPPPTQIFVVPPIAGGVATTVTETVLKQPEGAT
jgi:hypothetical protein